MVSVTPKVRSKRLFSTLDESIDAVLISNLRAPFFDDNFKYLTDAKGGLFEWSLAIATRNKVTIITSLLEEGLARKTGCMVHTFKSKKEFELLLKNEIKNKKRIGINFEGMTLFMKRIIHRNAKGVKFIDISKQLEKCRMIKDDDELRRIRKAASIASKVAEEIPGFLEVGMTEREAAAKLDYLLKCNGADGSAFDTIVAFGTATALPHYRSGDRKLSKGSVALFDFGASYQNYVSDITRTFFTRPIDPKLEKIYHIVWGAQSAAISKVRSGISVKSIDNAARKYIQKHGYEKYFIHSTGHGLGISVHDPGMIAKNSKDILKEKMVFTIEPGVYIRGRGGIRIEDDVIVRKDRAEIITKASRELRAI